MPTMATTAAVMAAKGLIVSGVEKKNAMRTIKTKIATNPTPVPNTKLLWLISLPHKLAIA